jgi:tripartite-type tricarboxylate transporter receptor subunit TctC
MPNVLVVSASSALQVGEGPGGGHGASGGLKYASSGIGSTQHIAGEAFNLATGGKATTCPTRAARRRTSTSSRGEVDMMFDSTSSAMGQIKAGKFRPLAVTADKRAAELPDVPTLAEQGIRNADVQTWYGLYVTAGTPQGPSVDKLVAELTRTLKLADVQARIKGLGGEVGAITWNQFTEMNRSEFDRYGKLVRDANIKARRILTRYDSSKTPSAISASRASRCCPATPAASAPKWRRACWPSSATGTPPTCC